MSGIEKKFLSLIHHFRNRIVGTERSLKISVNDVDAGRLLCGVDNKGMTVDEFIQKLSPFNPSTDCVAWLRQYWKQSNFLYLAIESADTSLLFNEKNEEFEYEKKDPVIKVYLEFPVLLSTQTNGTVEQGQKALWCIGYKWSPDLLKERITHYYLRPDIKISQLKELDLFKHLFIQDQRNLRLLSHLLHRQSEEIKAGIDILEVDTLDGSKGIDLRLYSLCKKVREMVPFLSDLLPLVTHHSSYPFIFKHFLANNEQILGHVSLGYQLEMMHVTFYWEV